MACPCLKCATLATLAELGHKPGPDDAPDPRVTEIVSEVVGAVLSGTDEQRALYVETPGALLALIAAAATVLTRQGHPLARFVSVLAGYQLAAKLAIEGHPAARDVTVAVGRDGILSAADVIRSHDDRKAARADVVRTLLDRIAGSEP